jgi:hypothetical protein
MRIEATATDDGIRVRDRGERTDFMLYTAELPVVESIETSGLPFPVDVAFRTTVSELSLDHASGAFHRFIDDDSIEELFRDPFEAGHGTHHIDITAEMKLHVVAYDTSFWGVIPDANHRDHHPTLRFDEGTVVDIGVRSNVTQPTGTLTTTRDPNDVMEVLSYMGTTMTEFTCERSYPTLRGHPPNIRLGDRVHVPSFLEKPATGVTLELPPRFDAIYPAAPLAMYLGAELVPSDTPRLRTDDGFSFSFDQPSTSIADEVERAFIQCHFLDCLTRVHGYYNVDLYEYNVLNDRIGFDFEALYDQPLIEQVEEYLSVPFATIQPYIPRWILSTLLRPDPAEVELLPYLLNDFSLIRVKESEQSATPPLRNAYNIPDPIYTAATTLDADVNGYTFPAGYRNRVQRDPIDGGISVAVVCNDEQMRPEMDEVGPLYTENSGSTTPTVTADVYQQTTTAELAQVFEHDYEFLHYIGHVREGGFECTDGTLNVESLSEVHTHSFLLNGCQSYQQGIELVRAGAIGGIATMSNVSEKQALATGSRLGRLISCGLPLGHTLDLLYATNPASSVHYRVIGDGATRIASTEKGQFRHAIETYPVSRDELDVTFASYPTTWLNMGSVVRVYGERTSDQPTLVGTRCGPFTLTPEELINDYGTYDPEPTFVFSRNGRLIATHLATELTVEQLQAYGDQCSE